MGEEGTAGRRNPKKKPGRRAVRGNPDEQEQRARRSIGRLFGLGRKGADSGLYGTGGLGGLKESFEGLKGRDPGENVGLRGLGTRGSWYWW